jgi:hypothetical protein
MPKSYSLDRSTMESDVIIVHADVCILVKPPIPPQTFAGYEENNMQKKNVVVCALACLFLFSGSVMAQRDPFLREGSQELALSGLFDFEREGKASLELTARYGYLLRDYLELGGFAEIDGKFDEVFRYGLGAFAEYHMPNMSFLPSPRVIPYLGLDVGLQFVASDISEDNAALVLRPRAGLKWYVREYFAIDTSFFFAVATDDIFFNNRDDLDPYDVGLQLGLRLYFK